MHRFHFIKVSKKTNYHQAYLVRILNACLKVDYLSHSPLSFKEMLPCTFLHQPPPTSLGEYNRCSWCHILHKNHVQFSDCYILDIVSLHIKIYYINILYMFICNLYLKTFFHFSASYFSVKIICVFLNCERMHHSFSP